MVLIKCTFQDEKILRDNERINCVRRHNWDVILRVTKTSDHWLMAMYYEVSRHRIWCYTGLKLKLQNAPDYMTKSISLNENGRIVIEISLKFVLIGIIDNKPASVQVAARRQIRDKPLPEQMVTPSHYAIWRHYKGLNSISAHRVAKFILGQNIDIFTQIKNKYGKDVFPPSYSL